MLLAWILSLCMPESAVSSATAAAASAEAAQEAADSVETATLSEAKTYLNIP